ncbi:MAG: hypothetical protein GXO29_01610 [Thermotogae bacterium]|nr:hypothetical protein [Thermotogota bacterium]
MGFFVYTAGYATTGKPEISLGVVVVVGGGKEAYDRFTGKGHPELADFVWTLVGGGVGYVLSAAVE